jgi:bifunctional DNA-binding transcriptional regulator/antitoxin component of YhaV-PrlF toxin-antitoxin module
VRAALGLEAGSRIDFIEFESGRYAIIAVTRSLQELKGVIPKPAKPVSIEEMNEAIAAEAAKAAKIR